MVRAYLKQHPVPPEVLQKLERDVLGPTADYSINYRDGWNPTRLRKNRLKLAGFMEHWRNPASAKRRIGHRGWRKYDPQSVMAVLLAATVYAEERDWRQGQAAEMFRALHLLKMKRLPGYTSFPRSGKARRQTVIIPGLIRRLLAQVISERLGVYLLTTAREVIAWSKVPRPAKKRRPQYATPYR